MTPLAIQSYLKECGQYNCTRRMVALLTFTKVSYPLSVDGVTVLVHIRDEEVAEMSDDRPTDAFCDNPLHDRFSFDVAKLFHRQFLGQKSNEDSYRGGGKTYIFNPIHVIYISPFIVLPSRSPLHPG
jgi:hypothetical protein